MTVKSTRCCRHPHTRQAIPRPPAKTLDHASTPPSATRQLYPYVGCLDRCDRYDSWLQPELVSGFACDQRHDPVWARLDLDLGCDAVLDHARDDADKAVAG